MPREARIDQNGVLLEHGFCSYERGIRVAEDFDLEPGKWKWDGVGWIPSTPPKPQLEKDREAALAQIDQAIADPTSNNFKEALKAIKKIL